MDPDKRAFPHGRVVYEIPRQTQTETDPYDGQLLHLGAFDTVEFEIFFPSAGKRLVLPLISDSDGVRLHQYRRIERFEGGIPVELFLKYCGGGDGDDLKLHCVSVPVKFVRACLAGKGGAMIGLRALEE